MGTPRIEISPELMNTSPSLLNTTLTEVTYHRIFLIGGVSSTIKLNFNDIT